MGFEKTARFWIAKIARLAWLTCSLLLLVPSTWPRVTPGTARVAAQSDDVVWSEPIQLSDASRSSWTPVAAADTAGNIHVMWTEQADSNAPPTEVQCLVYTRWDGTSWSPPIDVLVAPEGRAQMPDIAVTDDGLLHAVWSTAGRNSQLMYAHAPACCAGQAKNWSEPLWLGAPVELTTALVADDRGRLHAAFASQETGHVVYRRSDNSGATWPVYVDVLGPVLHDGELAAYPRLAVDGRGRVHAVWSVLPWPGRRVVYARSDDGGDTWGEARVIDSVDYGHYADDEGDLDYGPIFIDIEASGENEVHLIWDGAPTVERNHMWSHDGGRTWSGPDLLFPERTGVGRQGWNDMVIDSTGVLHAVSLGQPMYDTWPVGDPSRSMFLAEDRETAEGRESRGAEWMRIALGLGNQLHIVWADYEPSDQPHVIWYVRGEISAPPATPQPLPITTSVPLPTPTPMTTGISSPVTESGDSPVSTGSRLNSTLPSASSGPMGPVLEGIFPAFLIVSIVLAMKALQSQGRRTHR